jgi:DNA-binding MarR family transcriptional regulator
MSKVYAQSEAVDVICRECLATRMRSLNRVVSGVYDRAFRPIGLTASQVSILVVLAATDGAKPAEVCLALQIDKSTLSRNIQLMQRQGWVQTAATKDARSHLLEVTEVGRGLIEQALPLWRGAQVQARDVLGHAVVDQLFEAVDVPFSDGSPAKQASTGIAVPADARDRRAASPVSSDGIDGLSPTKQSAGGAHRRPAIKEIFFWE